MKKMLVLTVLLLVPAFLHALDTADPAVNTVVADASAATAAATAEAQNETTIIVYDVYKHMENSSNVFLGIGGVSFALGAAMATTAHDNGTMLGAGLQSVVWGAAITGLYIYDKNFVEKDPDPEKARIKFAEMSGWHALFDIGLMIGGGCLAIFGNEGIKGHGLAVLIEAAMLATYDGLNFFIASNPQDVKDWNAGLGYNFKFAGL